MKLTLLLSLTLLFACAHKRDKDGEMPVPGSLEEALSSSARAKEHEERDEYQHPKETLEFFGLRPEMTVVEITPGAGYFAEIIAPYLAKQGFYYMAIPRLPSNPPPFMLDQERRIAEIMLQSTEVKDHTRIIPFEPLDKRNRTRAAFADMVVSFSNVHNWEARESVSESFKFIFDVLKPGGILGLTQHRVREGQKKIPKSGYMTEKEVIALAQAAGLKFLGKSEINANPKDTADYPGGVWVLPPTYRLGEENRSRYEKIGESDRMTLKFQKP